MSQNRDQPEVQIHVGTFEVYVVAHVALRISIVTAVTILRHQYAILYHWLFLYMSTLKHQPS